MSAASQRGRRRAQPVHRPSIFGLASARTGTRTAGPGSASAVTATAKWMATVAVVGAIVAGGAVAQQVGSAMDPSLSSLLSAAGASSAPPAISAPDDAVISFSELSVTSSTSTSAPAEPTDAALKAEAAAIDPVAPATPLAAPAAPEPAAEPAPAAPEPAPAAVPVDDPAAAKAYAASQLAAFGWGADQMSCLTQLWQRESDWLTSAENPSSGAYGIVQSLPASKMESAGSDWATNYETQIRWGLGYIQDRYGSPCGAWGHSNAVNWY